MEHAIKAFKCYGQPLELGRHAALPLAHVRGARVRSLRGTLWITQEGDGHDHVVRAGESFTVERDGVTLVSAPQGPGMLLVNPPAPQHDGVLSNWLALSRNYLRHIRRPS